MRNAAKIQLPHPSTIRRVCNIYHANPQTEEDEEAFLHFTHERTKRMDEHEKIVTLIMDDMHL